MPDPFTMINYKVSVQFCYPINFRQLWGNQNPKNSPLFGRAESNEQFSISREPRWARTASCYGPKSYPPNPPNQSVDLQPKKWLTHTQNTRVRIYTELSQAWKRFPIWQQLKSFKWIYIHIHKLNESWLGLLAPLFSFISFKLIRFNNFEALSIERNAIQSEAYDVYPESPKSKWLLRAQNF